MTENMARLDRILREPIDTKKDYSFTLLGIAAAGIYFLGTYLNHAIERREQDKLTSARTIHDTARDCAINVVNFTGSFRREHSDIYQQSPNIAQCLNSLTAQAITILSFSERSIDLTFESHRTILYQGAAQLSVSLDQSRALLDGQINTSASLSTHPSETATAYAQAQDARMALNFQLLQSR